MHNHQRPAEPITVLPSRRMAAAAHGTAMLRGGVLCAALAAAGLQSALWAQPGSAQAGAENTGDEPVRERAEESLELPAGEGPSVEAMADVERAMEAYEASEQISEDAAVSFPVDI